MRCTESPNGCMDPGRTPKCGECAPLVGIDPAAILAAVEEEPPAKPVPQPPTIDTDRPYTTVYTDGSSTGGWGPWGWGWAVIDGPRAGLHGSGGGGWGTNQIGELVAVHQAMVAIPGLLLVVSDSEYAIGCLTTWLPGFQRKDWRGIKNAEVIRPAAEHFLARAGQVRLQWVKGHAGLPGNEEADRLSRQARLAVDERHWGPPNPDEREVYRASMSTIGKDLRR